MPRVRHILGLCALVLLVAYFGVWRGYETVSFHFGPGWGLTAGLAMLAGLIVIAVVGGIVIRAMRMTEDGAGATVKKGKNPPS